MQEKKISSGDTELFKESAEAMHKNVTSPVIYTEKKRHRNDPCSCGSGRKYKHCCEKKIASEKRHYYA